MLLSLVVRNILERGTPEALMPSPTCFSLSGQCDKRSKPGMDESGLFTALTIPGSRIDVCVTILECGLNGEPDLLCA
jgi:hypothetical protein